MIPQGPPDRTSLAVAHASCGLGLVVLALGSAAAGRPEHLVYGPGALGGLLCGVAVALGLGVVGLTGREGTAWARFVPVALVLAGVVAALSGLAIAATG